MVNKRYTAIYVLLAIAPIIYFFMVIGSVPDTVPTHFNIDGVADGFGSKWTLLFMPAVVAIVSISALFAPFLTKFAKQKDDKSLNIVAKFNIIVLLFLDLIAINIIYDGVHYQNDGKATLVINVLYLLNAFLLICGFFLPKLKRNGIIGIRLPFTLMDDSNWERTHQVGGKLMVLAGAIGLVLTFITNGSFWGGLVPMFIALGVTFLYSAVTFYKK